MKLQRAFTLAEILIVLTIIGVMAVMTIPSLIQNSNSQQKITQFKKAFNAVSNAYATEFALKSPPKSSDEDGLKKMFNALANQLNVKYYANAQNGDKYYSLEELNEAVGAYAHRIIVTEDGIAYRVTYSGKNRECKTKLEMNKQKSSDELFNINCIEIGVILDGKYKVGEAKTCNSTNGGSDKQNLSNLKCNALWVFVAKDGITAGNPDCTFSGRIMSDNIEYDATKCESDNNG